MRYLSATVDNGCLIVSDMQTAPHHSSPLPQPSHPTTPSHYPNHLAHPITLPLSHHRAPSHSQASSMFTTNHHPCFKKLKQQNLAFSVFSLFLKIKFISSLLKDEKYQILLLCDKCDSDQAKNISLEQ